MIEAAIDDHKTSGHTCLQDLTVRHQGIAAAFLAIFQFSNTRTQFINALFDYTLGTALFGPHAGQLNATLFLALTQFDQGHLGTAFFINSARSTSIRSSRERSIDA